MCSVCNCSGASWVCDQVASLLFNVRHKLKLTTSSFFSSRSFFLSRRSEGLASFSLRFDENPKWSQLVEAPLGRFPVGRCSVYWRFQIVSLIWINISRISGSLYCHLPITASKGPYAGGFPFPFPTHRRCSVWSSESFLRGPMSTVSRGPFPDRGPGQLRRSRLQQYLIKKKNCRLIKNV